MTKEVTWKTDSDPRDNTIRVACRTCLDVQRLSTSLCTGSGRFFTWIIMGCYAVVAALHPYQRFVTLTGM